MKSKNATLIKTVSVKNKLGEGVIYRHQTNSVWWTDIKSNQVYRYCLSTEKLKSWSTPYSVCSFGFTENEMTLITAFDRGIAIYNLESKAIHWLAQPELNFPGNRFNDGKMDRQGRFWAGSMVESKQLNPKDTLGALYCLETNGQCHQILNDIHISNGLCWSPDNQFVYHADSPKRQINRYSFNINTGRFSNKSIFAHTEENCFPDGSTIDANGNLWNAQWGGSQVLQYSPNGTINQRITLPVSQPTCVALGGENDDLLFVTSARDELSLAQQSKQPLAGDLLIYSISANTIPEPFSALIDLNHENNNRVK